MWLHNLFYVGMFIHDEILSLNNIYAIPSWDISQGQLTQI